MPKVYVPQDDGRHDLDNARRFGTIVAIWNKDLYPDNANEQIPEIMRRAYDVLHDFNPQYDFLCLVGSPVYTAICSYVLGDSAKQPLRLLRFDRLERAYYEIKLS